MENCVTIRPFPVAHILQLRSVLSSLAKNICPFRENELRRISARESESSVRIEAEVSASVWRLLP